MELYTSLARFYDALEGPDRDYSRDARWLDDLFRRHGCHRIVDVTCGTGSHIVELAKLGYDLTGLDASGPMLHEAARSSGAKGCLLGFEGRIWQTSG